MRTLARALWPRPLCAAPFSSSSGAPSSVWAPLVPSSFVTCPPAEAERIRQLPAVAQLLQGPEEKRTLRALNDAAGGDVLLDTAVHNLILYEMQRHLESVSASKRDGQPALAGSTGRLLSCVFGAVKGAGKSWCMDMCARLAPVLYPNVVPVYCSMQLAARKGYLGDPDFIEKLMAAAMEQCGVPLQSSQGALGLGELYDDLAAAQDKRMLLMLDEFESVYQVREGSLDQVAARHAILETVGVLAAGGPGRVVTELSGSSTHLRSLITASAADNGKLVERFRVLEDAPHLNGTKLPMVIPSQLLPNDIDAAEGMVRAWLSNAAGSSKEGEAVRAVVESLQAGWLREGEAAIKHAASLLLFKGGGTPRGVVNAAGDLLGGSKSDGGRRGDKDATLKPMRDVILTALAAKNKKLVRRVKGCNLTLDSSRRLPDGWWNDLRGVRRWDMVRSMTIVSKVTTQQMEWHASFRDLDNVVDVLVDGGFLLEDEGLLYPARAEQLLDRTLTPMPLRVRLLNALGGLSGVAGFVPQAVWEAGWKWLLLLLTGAAGLVAMWGSQGLEEGKELGRRLVAAVRSGGGGGGGEHQEDKEGEE